MWLELGPQRSQRGQESLPTEQTGVDSERTGGRSVNPEPQVAVLSFREAFTLGRPRPFCRTVCRRRSVPKLKISFVVFS